MGRPPAKIYAIITDDCGLLKFKIKALQCDWGASQPKNVEFYSICRLFNFKIKALGRDWSARQSKNLKLLMWASDLV